MNRMVRYTLFLVVLIVCFWQHHQSKPPIPPTLDLGFTKSAQCRESYKALFRDPVLDIRIFFGYKDSRPSRFVGDRYEALAFDTILRSSCKHGELFCGFKKNMNRGEVLEKEVRVNGENKIIKVEIYSSSIGPDDSFNRVSAYQKWLSQERERQFDEALRKAQIVFYNGHSRNGGGPDFSPPQLRRDNTIDFKKYNKSKDGVVRIRQGLESKDGRLQLFGLFSCQSENLIKPIKKNHLTKVGLISSQKLLYHSESLLAMKASLEALLKLKCDKEINQSLREFDMTLSNGFK